MTPAMETEDGGMFQLTLGGKIDVIVGNVITEAQPLR
jgi:hypothetical protein